MEKLKAPETKKFKPFEISDSSTSEEILKSVDTYISEIGEIAQPLDREFDPKKEFQNARNSPDRKKAVTEFKRDLQNQIQGMSSCRILIESIIAQNSNVDSQVLLDILDMFAKRYGLPESDLESYKNTLINLVRNVRKVKTLREEFPSDLDLLNSVLVSEQKFDSSTEFKITETPYGFIIYLKSSDAKKFLNGAEHTAGFSTSLNFKINKKDEFGKDLYINCPVAFIVTDSTFISEGKITKEQVVTHELEHNKTSLFLEHGFHSAFPEKIKNFSSGRGSISEYRSFNEMYREEIQQFQEMIDQYPDMVEKYNEYIAKAKFNIELNDRKIIKLENELYFELNKYCLETIFDIYKLLSNEFISRKKDQGNHDMENVIKNYSDFANYNKFIDNILSDLDYNPAFKSKITNLKDKYKEIFNKEALKASDSFDKLVNEGGYSIDEAIALLSYTPLQLWSKKIDRIIKTKK